MSMENPVIDANLEMRLQAESTDEIKRVAEPIEATPKSEVYDWATDTETNSDQEAV